MKVYSEPCPNCLLSKDRIVSPQRAKQIIQECAKNQTHFICHKASINGDDICCKTFFDTFGHLSQNVRIAQRLNCVTIVPQIITEKLTPYSKTK